MRHVERFSLLLIALLLPFILLPLGLISTIIYCALRIFSTPAQIIDYLSTTALSLALCLDLLGNVVCKDLFNATLRKPGGYAFGVYNETISSVLGKNKARGTLTDAGRLLANLLNWLDREPNHVERAAGLIA